MDLVLITLNCGKLLQSAKAVEELVAGCLTDAPPLLVLAFQEVAPILESSFASRQQYLDPIYSGVETALKHYSQSYVKLAENWIGGIGVVVYSPPHLADSTVQKASVGFGYLWSSLKAAAAVRIKIDGTNYTFVSTHLAANEGHAEARNRDFAILTNGLTFGNDRLYMNDPHNHLFVLGDLNYRSLKDVTAEGEAEGLVASYSADLDELAVEKANGNTLWGLSEAAITFAPTFKFFAGTNSYNRHRTPSWCDRILFMDPDPTIHKYSSVPSYLGSDHKPVFLQVSVHSECASPLVNPPSVWHAPQELAKLSDLAVGSAVYSYTTVPGRIALAVGVLLLFYLVF